jgi:hypothetical protein
VLFYLGPLVPNNLKNQIICLYSAEYTHPQKDSSVRICISKH